MKKVALLAVASLAVTLALAACGSDGNEDASADGVNTVQITLTEAGCPATLEVPAGPTTFVVTNQDAAAISEFEILEGDQILGEVEGVPPGLEKSFSLNLDGGSYGTLCPGGTTTERGTLTVSGEGGGGAVSTASIDTAVNAYRVYVETQVAELVSRTNAFTQAVLDGDQEKAKSLFAWAREPYEQIEPVAEAFGDLDPEIDARENDVPDASWTGFHRLEKALWVDASLKGMEPVAKKLRADVAKLQTLVATVELDPAQIANGATELLGEVSRSKITGEEDRYSHTDLWDFQANVDGARAAFNALRPVLEEQDAALATLIAKRFTQVDRALDPYRDGDGFVLYVDLTEQDTRGLSQSIDALAEPLSTVAGTVVAA